MRACSRAGLHDFLFHDLRYSAAGFIAMAGVGLMVIKQVLGYKTIQMTLWYSLQRSNFTIFFTVARERASCTCLRGRKHPEIMVPEEGVRVPPSALT